jgi:hypothetical protein
LQLSIQARETWKPNRKLQIKRKEKNRVSCADKTWFLQFLPSAKFLLILFSINFLILAPFPFGPWSQKGLQIGLQLVFKL